MKFKEYVDQLNEDFEYYEIDKEYNTVCIN